MTGPTTMRPSSCVCVQLFQLLLESKWGCGWGTVENFVCPWTRTFCNSVSFLELRGRKGGGLSGTVEERMSVCFLSLTDSSFDATLKRSSLKSLYNFNKKKRQ